MKGEAKPTAHHKLTCADIDDIQDKYLKRCEALEKTANCTMKAIAADFGLSKKNVWDMVHNPNYGNRYYKHKVNAPQLKEIRRRHALRHAALELTKDFTVNRLAASYGVHRNTIWAYVCHLSKITSGGLPVDQRRGCMPNHLRIIKR